MFSFLKRLFGFYELQSEVFMQRKCIEKLLANSDALALINNDLKRQNQELERKLGYTPAPKKNHVGLKLISLSKNPECN